MKYFVTYVRSAARLGALVAGLFAATAPTADAQSAYGGRFQAWVGCWSAEQTIVGSPTTIGPIVCITPTSDPNVVEVATLQEGKVVAREKLDATGREQAIDAKGCTATQRANWSTDGRRVYLRSAGSCEGIARSTSGILAITPSGEWLDIQGITAGDGSNVRVARYRDIGVPRSVPAEIASALSGRDLTAQNARIAAGAPVRMSDVVEASRAADSLVVEAWLLEREQRFAVSARDLVMLADAGVPARVTDALVAVSNPQSFALARADEDAPDRGSDEIGGRGVTGYPDIYGAPWGWGYYSPYRYGRGYYGGSLGYPGFYNPPVVIVDGRGNRANGRMVKGQGYTQDAARSGSGEASSTRTTRPSQPSSAGSSTRSPDRAPSAPARTAKPRS